MHFFENTGPRSLAHLSITPLESVISAWSAGIQIDKDVSGDIPATWMPAIHTGMTMICIFMFCRWA
jgi:hypothetical protein